MYMTTCPPLPKEINYVIKICNGRNVDRMISFESNTNDMDCDICSEIACVMVYKQNTKFLTFNEYKFSEEPPINVDVIVKMYEPNGKSSKKIYKINENLLMYIYNYKFDEYYLESEYEISDWAISSDSSDDFFE
jgi:hypothetical protein